ncbi:MAG: transposase [Acetobacteraceae bacterium]|nr:transposase [Acetobacteraceae bacterium]
MWMKENLARYDRGALGYPSELTDAAWTDVTPIIPPAKRGGNKRKVKGWEVVNGLTYILSRGCQSQAIPKGLSLRSTADRSGGIMSHDPG